MMGDYQVRFCERLGGATPPCLLGGSQEPFVGKEVFMILCETGVYR